ncbi:hypothetical protein [Legionella sp. CNM-4043-24]|uniref:hypothetical protein n=1 Tax=Legionella sp. CNM-4043-24 TaxID=3421646 RepID=UPI00403B1FB4
MRVNPFSFLYESRIHPHARTLRTSFPEKWRDTFSVFYGDIYTSKREARMGLFDWATLGITAFLARSEVHLWGTSCSLWRLPLAILAYALNRMIIVPRFLISAITAIAATPFTLLAAGIVRLVDWSQCPNGLDETGLVEGTVKANWLSSSKPVNKRHISLGQLFRESNSNLNDMFCTKITSDRIKMRVCGRTLESPTTYTFTCERNNVHANRFFRYNIGRINNVLECSEPTPAINR